MAEQLTVVPESIITQVVRRDRDSRIGLPMRRMVVVGRADDSTTEVTLLGSREQITNFVGVEYDLDDSELEELLKEIDERPRRASVDTLWRNHNAYEGFEGLLNPNQWLNLGQIRTAFNHDGPFVEGAYAVASRPARSAIVLPKIPSLWIPTDVFSRNGWAVEELKTEAGCLGDEVVLVIDALKEQENG